MSTSRARRRATLAVLAVAAAGSMGGCGGGGAAAPTAPAAPAAGIDPSSDNVVTGPINEARETADAQEARERAIEQAGAGEP